MVYFLIKLLYYLDSNSLFSHSTLVIAPATLIYQWEAEIKKHVERNHLTVYVFHGPKDKRENDPRK